MFKFGLLTAILDGWSLEEAVKTASEMGFECLEVACWPKGGAERRYAGTSHIDAERLIADEGYRRNVEDLFAKYHMSISSLAYYPNVLDPDQEKSAACITHLKAVIAASHLLGVNLVTTFIGRNQNLDLEANIELFKNVWPDIISYAESLDTRVAIENCPMLFGRDQWPGGQNLMCTPVVYRRLFEIIPSKNFGLNFDPSHYVWQQMDYVRTLYEFRERIFHIHFKDIKLYPEKLAECGVLAYPLDYMAPKIPGLGDVNWSRFISAMHDIDFQGCAVIEVEDKSFEGSKEDILHSIRQSAHYLKNYI